MHHSSTKVLSKGYTGEQCTACGSLRVKHPRSEVGETIGANPGACTVCDDCGTTSGCS